MYKFEISADSPQELREKMAEFANEMVLTNPLQDLPKYIDEPVEEQLPFPKFVGVEPQPMQAIAPSPSPSFLKQPEVVTPFPAITQTIVATPIEPKPEPQQSAGVVEVDSRGFRWDPRIHSANRSFCSDGTWRTRRGLPDGYLEQVEFEIHPKTSPIKTEITVAQPTPAPVVVQAPVFVDSPQTKVVEPALTSQPQNGVTPAHSFGTFRQNLPMLLTQLVNENKINQSYIGELNKYFGTAHIWNVVSNESQCLELFEMFASCGFITKVG